MNKVVRDAFGQSRHEMVVFGGVAIFGFCHQSAKLSDVTEYRTGALTARVQEPARVKGPTFVEESGTKRRLPFRECMTVRGHRHETMGFPTEKRASERTLGSI